MVEEVVVTVGLEVMLVKAEDTRRKTLAPGKKINLRVR